jgi:hypothetical protein
MNVVYLSPHFPAHYYQFCKALKATGANVLGLGDESYDNLRPELKAVMTEYYLVPDMHTYDELLKALGYFTFKYGRIQHLDSHNEYWLETEARLRDDFNIPGIKTDTISQIRKKSKMKELFIQAGVKVARGRIVKTQTEAKKFIREVGYPVVAKPDSGVGALSTYKISNDEELKTFFKNKPDVDYLMEEFIEGTIYSFDGLTDSAGKIVFYTSHVYSQGIMEIVNENRNVYYYSLRKIPQKLEQVGKKCVKTFNVRDRFFHLEFFKTKTGEFVALEVNMRPPGGFTTDMFNFACDIDIYQAWADLIVHRKSTLPYSRKYHVCYAGRKIGPNYLHSHQDILDKFGKRIVHHEHIAGVFSSALGNYGYLFRSENLDDIFSVANFIQATY